jgi:DDE family transposase
MKQTNAAAEADPTTLRLSMDAKATVAVGPFSRKGKSRVATKACDHDFKPEATVTPVGILLPATADLFIYEVTSPVTSDCLVDCLSCCWETIRQRFPAVTTLELNLDNGPESQSRRTQFMARIVDFVRRYQITVQLAYYPPYHSKYNPIERCWGALEHHWNGSLLDSLDAVLKFTNSMTWKGLHPLVELVTTTYATGVKLTKQAMADIETQIVRLPGLDKWFVSISPATVWEI